jgi:plastocyanin domain-containing protein
MNKSTILSIFIALILIGAVLLLTEGEKSEGNRGSSDYTTTVIGNRQFVEVLARGGYSPRVITAKANIPLTLKMSTDTFDCSAFVVIPAIGYRGTLNRNGSTDVLIPAQPAGTTIRGACTMGMYGFVINYQ